MNHADGADNDNREEIDLQGAIDRHFPLRRGMSLLAGPILDRSQDLYPEEAAAITRAIPRRRFEFATGRFLARQAMKELEAGAVAIPRGDNREPVWPAKLTGSITHAEDWAVAGVGRKDNVLSLGLDLEVAERVGDELYPKLFTDRERRWIAAGPEGLAGLMFSAKEAVYKATFPLAGKFIGFKEAEVTVDWVSGRFRFRYVGDYLPNKVMERADGYFLLCGRYVLSLVIIPV